MIPKDIKEAIDDYVRTGHDHGSFVMACLRNNFADAVLRADEENYRNIRPIAVYLCNNVPAVAWGSAATVAAWQKRRQQPSPPATGAAYTSKTVTIIKE